MKPRSAMTSARRTLTCVRGSSSSPERHSTMTSVERGRIAVSAKIMAASGFTPLGLDHVVLRVRDQAATQQFYIDVLGCTLERINAPLSLIHLRFGEQLIDLLPGNGDGGTGMDHVCLS